MKKINLKLQKNKKLYFAGDFHLGRPNEIAWFSSSIWSVPMVNSPEGIKTIPSGIFSKHPERNSEIKNKTIIKCVEYTANISTTEIIKRIKSS